MTLVKPVVPQTVIRWVGERIPQIPPSAAQTVAVPLIHDWGPLASDPPGTSGVEGGPQLLSDFADWTQVFGDGDTPGRTAVAGAFAGQSLPGYPGAGAVIAYRMAGSAVAKATITIPTAGISPVDGLTLEARYYGSRGNHISYVRDTDPADSSRDRLRVLYKGRVEENYSYAQTDVAALAAAINLRSKLVRATNEEDTPARLAVSSGTDLAGGNDGAVLTGQDHIDALDALEFGRFTVLSPYDVTSSEIQASYVSWVTDQVDANRPVYLVIGGNEEDTIDTALTRTLACNGADHVVNFGVGVYHDDLLDKDLTTSQLAPRIAGIIAAKGEQHSLTSSKIGGLHPVGKTGATADAVEAAVQLGVTVLMRTSADDAELRIAKGVSTFTSTTDPIRPYETFSDVRLVRIMDLYVRRMKQWGDDIVIGALPVNEDTRKLVYGYAMKLQRELLRDGLILPGDDVLIPKPWVVVQNTDADPQLRKTIPYNFGWQFAGTTEAILGEGHVR